MSENKNKKLAALDEALKLVNKSFKTETGDLVIAKLSDKPIDVKTISSGSLVLDSKLGGGLAVGRIIEIYGPEGSGKCLDKNALIQTSIGLLTMEEVFAHCDQSMDCVDKVTEVKDYNLQVLNENSEMENVVALTHNNKRSTKKVTLSDGRSQIATYNHPVRVWEDGYIVWKKFDELKEGDIVVSKLGGAEQVESKSDLLSKSEAVLLGYLLSKGDLLFEDGITFTDKERKIKEEYRNFIERIAEDFGLDVEIYEETDEANAVSKLYISSENILDLLNKEFGIPFKNFSNTYIPRTVRSSSVGVQKAFLSGLFEGKGLINESGQLLYPSNSKKLVEEIQLMLRSLGIPSVIDNSHNADSSDSETSVLVLSTSGTELFSETIGFISDLKERATKVNITKVNDHIDTRIAHLYPLVKSLIRNVSEGGEINDNIDDCCNDKEGFYSEKAINKIITLVKEMDYLSPTAEGILLQLRSVFENKYTFEEVVSIQEHGEIPTFDLVLDKTHSFVANGIINHNTSIALTAIGNVQKEGGVAAFIDLENALDPRYARKLGVNIDELAVSQPDNAEQALDLVETLAQTGVVDIIVVDSVAALVPKSEIEGSLADQSMALVARLMSKALRKLARTANQNNCTVIFINQIREKVGVMYGSPEITPGGKALKFFASQRIDVRRREQIKEGKETIGNKIQLKVVKNKIAPPFGVGETVLTYNKGINKAAEMIETGVEYGIIDLTGRTYTEIETGEVITTRSKAAAVSALEDNTEQYERLAKRLAEKMDSKL